MSRRVKKGAIVGAFVAHSLEMRGSAAWLALSNDARRLLMRLELEHMQHGGSCNGELSCTYADLVRDGIARTAIPIAIRQCCALGFLEITRKGRPSISSFRRPSLYRLTYLHGRGRSPEPTNEWRRLDDAGARLALSRSRETSHSSAGGAEP